jgi:hypothetical protein
MSKFSDGNSTFRSGTDSRGNVSSDRIDHGGSSSHEHTWSKTATDGQHKEGWHGSNASTSGNRGSNSGGSGK